jgi:hypothetical protein
MKDSFSPGGVDALIISKYPLLVAGEKAGLDKSLTLL